MLCNWSNSIVLKCLFQVRCIYWSFGRSCFANFIIVRTPCNAFHHVRAIQLSFGAYLLCSRMKILRISKWSRKWWMVHNLSYIVPLFDAIQLGISSLLFYIHSKTMFAVNFEWQGEAQPSALFAFMSFPFSWRWLMLFFRLTASIEMIHSFSLNKY